MNRFKVKYTKFTMIKMFEENIENQIGGYVEDLEELIENVESTKEAIIVFLNDPNMEEQLIGYGEELKTMIYESYETLNPHIKQLESDLKDENVLNMLQYYEYEFGDIKNRMIHCLNEINELKKLEKILTNKIEETNKQPLFEEKSIKMNDFRKLDL